jgi:hypothetical protein
MPSAPSPPCCQPERPKRRFQAARRSREIKQGIKTGLAGPIAYAFYGRFQLKEGYWAVFTALIVTQANLGASWRAALYRTVGTTNGAVSAALLTGLIGTGPVRSGVLLFLLTAFFAYLTTQHASFSVAGFTVALVLFFGHQPQPWDLAWYRVLYTVAGAPVAFAVVVSMWPVRAREGLRATIVQLLEDCSGLVTESVLTGTVRQEDLDDLGRAILDHRRAVTQALDEASSEPAGSRFDHDAYVSFVEQLDRIRQRLLAMSGDNALYAEARIRNRLVPHLPKLCQSISQDLMALGSEVCGARGVIDLSGLGQHGRPGGLRPEGAPRSAGDRSPGSRPDVAVLVLRLQPVRRWLPAFEPWRRRYHDCPSPNRLATLPPVQSCAVPRKFFLPSPRRTPFAGVWKLLRVCHINRSRGPGRAGTRAALLASDLERALGGEVTSKIRKLGKGGSVMKIAVVLLTAGAVFGAWAVAETNAGSQTSGSAAQSASVSANKSGAKATSQTSATANQPAAASGSLTAGSQIHATLTKPVDAKKSRAGEEFIAKTTSDIKSNGAVIVPRGSKIIGHVTEAKAGAKGEADSTLGLAFDRAVLKNGQEIPFSATIRAIANSQPPSSEIMAPDEMPSVAGAAPGGGFSRPSVAPVGETTRAVGTTAGGLVHTAGDVAGDAGAGATGAVAPTLDASGHLTSASQGVIGLKGMSLGTETAGSAQGSSVIHSNTGNVHLDGGTQMLLVVK